MYVVLDFLSSIIIKVSEVLGNSVLFTAEPSMTMTSAKNWVNSQGGVSNQSTQN